LFEYDVIISRSETTIIRVEALDQDDALDKAEAEAFLSENSETIVWEPVEDYTWHIIKVDE
jgi:hypothetical protein